MTEPNANSMPEVSYPKFYKSLRQILKRNFYFIILNLVIKPQYLEICFALRMKDKEEWYPKVVRYARKPGKVGFYNTILDVSPTVVDVKTILTMDENKVLMQ